jgi:hypothetical protein
VEPLAAVAQGFFGPDVGRSYEPVQERADVEDHLGHCSLPASLFVNSVLVRGQRPEAMSSSPAPSSRLLASGCVLVTFTTADFVHLQ